MTSIVGIMFIVCGGFWLFQLCMFFPFFVRMRRPTAPQSPVKEWPKIFVAMPLRGADDSLEIAMRSVLAQDYPDFEIRIVVDHESDAAWDVVRRVIAETGAKNIQASPLRTRSEKCSLVCSSLSQIVDDLKDQEGLMAFCAADMHPPRNWLREMATLLADPNVGSTLGNRWYMPPRGQWGSLVQYLWNAAAVVPMWLFEIAWGGASALRLKDIRDSGLEEKWREGMVEDATINRAVHASGMRLEFSPRLFVVDRGELALPRACQFIYRQLLWTRLYHPRWISVVLNALFTTGIMLAPFIAALAQLLSGNLSTAWSLLGIGLAYILGNALLAFLMDRTMRRALKERSEVIGQFSPLMWLRICVAIPLTQVIYATAMIFAAFAHEVTWRGVRYRLDGPWNVRMLGYKPYSHSSDSDQSNFPSEPTMAREGR